MKHTPPKATPLAFLHGFAGTPELFAPTLALLPAGRPVIAPALPGHGAKVATTASTEGSAQGDARSAEIPSSFEAAVDAIAEALVKGRAKLASGEDGVAGSSASSADLRADPAQAMDLFAYSMGARLGLGLLIRHPSLFRSAVLVSARSGLPSGPERWARSQWEARWATLLRHQGLEAFVEAWETLPVFAGQSDAQRVLQRGPRLSQDPERLATSLDCLGLAAMPNYRADELASITTPTLLVAGERDPKFVHAATALAARMPCVELEVLAGLGHNPLVESPDRCAELLSVQSLNRLAARAPTPQDTSAASRPQAQA